MRAPRLPEYAYGDRLRVSGLLETPPEMEGFSYEAYLARQGIYSYIGRPRIELLAEDQGSPIKAAFCAVKDRARAAIARLVPEPEASLLQGIILGIRASIPRDLYDLFNATGTSHILVISGANLTIIAALLSRTCGRLLGKRRAYWFTLGGVGLYVLLVGAEPAVARAALMAGLYLTALYLGRHATAYVSLCASGLLLTAINPFSLWDVGFQLSFAATLGLILFSPALDRLFERGLARVLPQERAKKAVRYLDDLLIVTLAAQILTLPADRLSLWTVVAGGASGQPADPAGPAGHHHRRRGGNTRRAPPFPSTDCPAHLLDPMAWPGLYHGRCALAGHLADGLRSDQSGQGQPAGPVLLPAAGRSLGLQPGVRPPSLELAGGPPAPPARQRSCWGCFR